MRAFSRHGLKIAVLLLVVGKLLQSETPWISFQVGALALFLLSVIVLVHELGHAVCMIARGIQLQCIAIGFGEALTLFQFRGVDIKLGWVPLGGYVRPVSTLQNLMEDPEYRARLSKKSLGEIKDFAEAEAIPGSIEAASRSDRIIAYAGGPVASLLLGVGCLFVAELNYGESDARKMLSSSNAVESAVISEQSSSSGAIESASTAFSRAGAAFGKGFASPILIGWMAFVEFDTSLVTESGNGPSGVFKLLGDFGSMGVMHSLIMVGYISAAIGGLNSFPVNIWIGVPLAALDGGKILEELLGRKNNLYRLFCKMVTPLALLNSIYRPHGPCALATCFLKAR